MRMTVQFRHPIVCGQEADMSVPQLPARYRALAAIVALSCSLGSATAAQAVSPNLDSPDSPYETRGATPVALHVDADAQNLTYSVSPAPSGGTLNPAFTANGFGADATYTANNGFASSDTFTVHAVDPSDSSTTAIDLTVVVRPATELVSGAGVGATSSLTNDSTPTFSYRAVSGAANVTD